MKKVLLIVFLCTVVVAAQKYFRPFPNESLLSQINTKNFPTSDAVLIVKEQLIRYDKFSKNIGRTWLEGYSKVEASTKIVKILNQPAVERYGTFEYTYWDWFGDFMRANFVVRARILKPNGDSVEVGQENVKKINVLNEDEENSPEKKVVLKIPHLEVGDVLQLEYESFQPYSFDKSGLLYYNDRDIALYSNVYVTIPNTCKLDVFSYPENKIGMPQHKKLANSGDDMDTYFWSVRNCNSIPAEHYAVPFEDVSLLTAYILKEKDDDKNTDWADVGKNYFKAENDDEDVKLDDAYTKLDIPKQKDTITFAYVDSLYSKIKRKFRFEKSNSIYPAFDIKKLFSSNKADASDAGFLLYEILKSWKQDVNLVLIRDKREGEMIEDIPSLTWFDRVGVMVTVNKVEKLYDFDKSISNMYQIPWFVADVNLRVITDLGGYFRKIGLDCGPGKNQVVEDHTLSFTPDDKMKDSMQLSYSGSFATQLRGEYYNIESKDINKHLRDSYFPGCFSELDSITHNDIFEEPQVTIGMFGNLAGTAEKIDSFIVVKPLEITLSRLRGSMFSTVRKNDIKFDTPFRFVIRIDIPIPNGYAVKSLPDPAMNTTEYGAVYRISTLSTETNVSVVTVVEFKQNLIRAGYFTNIIQLLDEARKGINRDIVFIKQVKQ
jgi:hypothetical protein